MFNKDKVANLLAELVSGAGMGTEVKPGRIEMAEVAELERPVLRGRLDAAMGGGCSA